MATANERQSLLRILIATDNHLGVWEKDDLRKDDSFVTFEEIFKIAVEQRVDFVLLGGDLFHDNKPSRNTLVRAMDILSKYCLGDEPVAFQVISNQAENFVSGKVNYENPNFNVGLPVFTIHGNHDDPTGGDNLSAVDVLSSCNLVNYFGKAPLKGSSLGRVKIAPVLMQKGNTKLALYGLGNVRDERLARMFQTPGSVEWVRPAGSDEYPVSDWFNIFVLHQNRVIHTQTAKNAIKESYLPRFLDFVVWGHEHECLPDPKETASEAQGFSVVQPGSSVATALSEGESKIKHVLILEVLGEQWRIVKRALETVRPFLYDQVVLADRIELDHEDSEGLATFLEDHVQGMIERATRGKPKIDGRPAQLPLIRLKVDYTGFTTVNSQRFGQKFVGRVANPHEVLHWHKATVRKVKPERRGKEDQTPQQLDETHIEDLITEHLVDNLAILPEVDLANALHDFVDKDEKQALATCVTSALQATQKAAFPTAAGNDDDVENLLQKHAEERRQNAQENAASIARSHRTAGPLLPAPSETAEASTSAAPPPLPLGSLHRNNCPAAEAEEEPSMPASQARSNRPGRGRGRGGRQATLGEVVARGARGTSVAAGGNLDGLLQAGDHETTTQRSAVRRRAPNPPAATPTRGSARAASARAKQALAQIADDNGADDMSGSKFSGRDEDAVEDSDDDADDPMEEDGPRPTRKRGAPVAAARSAPRRRTEPSPQPNIQVGSAVAPILVDSDDEAPMPGPLNPARPARRLGRLLGSSNGSQAPNGRGAVDARAWGGVRR